MGPAWGGAAVAVVPSAGGVNSPVLGVSVGGSGWPAIAVRDGLGGLSAASTVTMRIWVPADAPALSVAPFTQDGAWAVHKTPAQSLVAGAWNTVTWLTAATTGINALGMQFDNPASWKGQVALQSVSW